MKCFFFLLCLLCIECAELRAQEGVFGIAKGDTVFWQITRQKVHMNLYKMQSPLYIVGVVDKVYSGFIYIKPRFYLYACSMASENWVKTPRLGVEKQSYTQQFEALEEWNVEEPLHYMRKRVHVKPWTQEAQKILTGGLYVSKSFCSKIIAINSTKPRTR